MKTRPRQGAIPAFVRTTALLVVGGIVMTATAKLAAPTAPPARRGPAPDTRALTPVHVTVEDASATFDLRPDRRGVVQVDPALVRGLDVGDELMISPRTDVASERFAVTRWGRDGIGSTWWRLDSTAFEESQAVLVERNGFVEVWMQSPGFGADFEWMFHAIGRGRMVPAPKAADLPGCGGSIQPPMGPQPPEDPGAQQSQARLAGGGVDECSGCGALDADIAFFYTPLVLERVESDLEGVGGDPDDAPDIIAVRCATDAALGTVAMENSDLPFGTRAVLVSMVEFDEQGENFLGRFAGTDDGDMDGIHAIRDEVGADACSLISLGDGGAGYCGVAFLGNGDSPGSAFSNVVWGCTGGLVFAHEFGHNLGCCHAAGDGGGCDEVTECTLWEPTWAGCCSPDPTGPNTPFPSFNHGWRFVVENVAPACVCTVMAYGKTNGAGSQRIPYFSNPEIEYNGVPTGSPEDALDERWADNASIIRATMPGTTRYRCENLSDAAESGRLVAAGLGEADFFGSAVATNGFFLAAGAEGHNVSAQDAGSVMIFGNPDAAPGEEDSSGWVQIGKLTPSDLAEGDLFGHSVAMDEDVLVVGAPYTHRIVRDELTGEVLEDHPLAGAASVWVGDGAGGYCRVQVLQPEDLASFDFFGSSVAVAGDLVAVGAPRRENASESGANHGAVWVYRRVGDVFEIEHVFEGDDGSAWPQMDPGDPAGTGGRFGTSVAATRHPDGRLSLLVGAPRERASYGYVHTYSFLPDADWTLVTGTPVSGDWLMGRLGTSVAISGEDAIAGAPGANAGKGAALVYRTLGAELVDEERLEYQNADGDLAGTSVAINETFAVIGVPGRDREVEIGGNAVVLEDVGAVAVFTRLFGSSNWSVRQQLQPDDLRAGDAFGSSTAIAGDRLFVGAPEADDAALLSGAVYALDITQIEDCDENGIDDSIDILQDPNLDCNLNGELDECEGSCAADLDLDGIVGGGDLGLLFVNWGACSGDVPGCPGDLDRDGLINGTDLGIFCASWGLICPDDPEP